MTSQYKDAGVNIDAANSFVNRIKADVRNTKIPGVLGDIGFFGGFFEINKNQYEQPVLVSSVDGVGTKIKIAIDAKIYDSVGQDLVNHCVNDIAVSGATPLFFLDYYGTGRLDVDAAVPVITGMAKACKENNCCLIGGETAEMPGFYQPGDFDLVGTIVGIVEKSKIITGKSISVGDSVIGVASTGLQTNGYSLARKILLEKLKLTVHDKFPDSTETVAQTLLKVHRSYLKAIQEVSKKYKIKGLAHLTGGGFLENIPRVLPDDLDVEVALGTWPVLHVFQILEQAGHVERDEMYRVFNMGIGMVFIVDSHDENSILNLLNGIGFPAYAIGKTVKGHKKVRLI